MRRQYNIDIKIPEGVTCEFDSESGVLKCKKGDATLDKKISIQGTELKVESEVVKLVCKGANKKIISIIKTNASHVENMFKGFEENFVYELEICNVHFPITAKVEGDKILISNFLGEKVNRAAEILQGVEVDVKGQKITVSGPDIEKTGQTAANIEKASKVTGRDRRIFQDGIYITAKPGGAI